MTRRMFATALLAVVGLAPALATAGEPISIGYLRGSSAVPIPFMQARAEKYGLQLQAREFVRLDALDRAFALGEFDVHSALSLNTWGTYLNQGKDFVGILGTLHPNGYLVVPKDSAFNALVDLKGKRVGVYGIHGTSTAIFGVIAAERFGMDIRKDLQLFGSVPPILPTLLDKREVDAILNLPPFVPQMIASGRYRVLLSLADEWRQLTGHGVPFTVMVAARSTLEKKRAEVGALVRLWREAIEHVRSHPETMNEYLAAAKITDPADLKIAYDMMVPHFMNTWTEKDIDNIQLYWKIAVDKGFMEKAVAGEKWFTLEFAR